VTARLSLWAGVVVVAVLFGWGAWERRWIADDGLIVLRTVRNLLAGNGPVFNTGERVEVNTSTIWTYLVYLGGWIGGPLRLEYVALVLALVLSVAGVGMAMLGAGRLYAPSTRGRRALLLPAGALVYIAVPPARDFATSGLENGLVLAYLGCGGGLWPSGPRRCARFRPRQHRRCREGPHPRRYAEHPSQLHRCRRPPTSSADSSMRHWLSSPG
jgi:arabinofuranosyltransferase